MDSSKIKELLNKNDDPVTHTIGLAKTWLITVKM